jgi:hypothetical protein
MCATFVSFLFMLTTVTSKNIIANDASSRSLNGGYMTCDFSAGDDWCIFALTEAAPPNVDYPDEDWQAIGAVEHAGTDLSPCGHNQGGFYCEVQDLNDITLISSCPAPWKNGDKLVATDTEHTGDDWTYALIFELVAPLRNLMMYHPETLDAAMWAKYTKAFVDCKVKDADEAGDHGTAFSVDNVYEIMKTAAGVDNHHHVLQFLEEGAIDLVCITTDLEMDRCDTMRAKWAVEAGTKCDCWQAAYKELFEVDAMVDVTLSDCAAAGEVTEAQVVTDAPVTEEPPTTPSLPTQTSGGKGAKGK